MLVGVFAGTKVDTKMGVDLLESKGIKTLSFPLAQNPDEQTKLQYYLKEDLENLFIEKARRAMEEGMDKIFIYCNSLSSAIDYEKISKILGLEVITPLETYKNLDQDIKNLFIIGANGISAYKIDEIVGKSRDDINTISCGNLSIVNSIEEEKSPQAIIEELNLKGLINYLENIRDERYKVDTILLGCTHFPYLKEKLEELTSLKIIDPAEDMIKRLTKGEQVGK